MLNLLHANEVGLYTPNESIARSTTCVQFCIDHLTSTGLPTSLMYALEKFFQKTLMCSQDSVSLWLPQAGSSMFVVFPH